MCVVPGKEYQLHARDDTEWGGWTLSRESGKADGDWFLHGPGFDGFGLGKVTLSTAHWKAFAYVVEFLTLKDGDPSKTIVFGESDMSRD